MTQQDVLVAIRDCIKRFEEESGSKPSALLVSQSVYNFLKRPLHFMGMTVIWDTKLKGSCVYCTMEELDTRSDESKNETDNRFNITR